MSFHSGKQGKVAAGGVDLPVTGWQGNFAADRVDVTSTAGGGFAEYIAGVLRGEVQFEALWDDVALPNANPPNLVEGQTVAVALHCAATGKTFAGNVLVDSMRYDSRVRGRVSYRCGGSFTGSYTRPS